MDGEISNLIMVWCYIFMSSCYCYATTKLVPKGTLRLFMFLPILYLFFHLPLHFSTYAFSNPTAFFITWLASFKLILLAHGTGPISNPSLSLIQFLLIFSLPINLQEGPSPKSHHKPNNNTGKLDLRSPSFYVVNSVFVVFFIVLCAYRDTFPSDVVLFCMCVYVYVGLEVMLGVIGLVGQSLLGTKIDAPFDDPFLSTSLQDFWGRRWNRVSSALLQSTVFYPTYNYTSRLLGRKWAANLALVVTFMASGLMHEVLFYYISRVWFSWSTLLFFILHGLLVSIESTLKRKLDVKWRLPQLISGPLVFGFVVYTFMRLVLPELLAYKLDDKIIGEYEAFATFVMDLGRSGLKWATT